MPNYYEQLKLQPSATTTEIEVAIEEQYNQWRRLVTHHDPAITEEANRSLRALEQIRSTLTDPVKRSGYDAGIGIGGQLSGLADPEALLKMAGAPPRSPITSNLSTTTRGLDGDVNSWVCPSCKTANPIKTKFCSKCGQRLGLDCPNCGKLTRSTDPFCMECGVSIQSAEDLRQKKNQEDEAEKRWLATILESATQSQGKLVAKAFRMSGAYQDVFDTLLEALKKWKSLGFVMLRIKTVDFAQGYILAKFKSNSGQFQIYIKKGESAERHVVVSCTINGVLVSTSARSTWIDLLVGELRKTPLNLKAVR